MKAKAAKWLDEVRMAGIGIVLATRKWKFWVMFVPVFLVFGTILSLLSGGMGAINLFFVSDFPTKMQILGDGFLSFFGKDRYFWDFFQNFAIAFLQALLISMIVFVYDKRKKNSLKQERFHSKQKQDKTKQEHNRNEHKRSIFKHKRASDDTGAIQNAGIAAGLALLGSGCPTCGTTLITPILAGIFSSSGYAVAGTISGIITLLAILLFLWSLKRVGVEAYAIIIDERWRKKRQNVEEK